MNTEYRILKNLAQQIDNVQTQVNPNFERFRNDIEPYQNEDYYIHTINEYMTSGLQGTFKEMYIYLQDRKEHFKKYI